jgi:16S rRNA (cytosine1402-N4)-methyltransferase
MGYKLSKKVDYVHTPVMLKEVLEFLNPLPGQNFIDCTLGSGGYTFSIAKRIVPRGKIIGIDLDEKAIGYVQEIINKNKNLSAQAGKNIVLVHDNFKNLHKIVQKYWPNRQATKFTGVVFDLGLSSTQLQDRSRGFSFQLDAPLDMAFSQKTDNKKQTTEYIVNSYKNEKLEKILREYGEERYARRIAGAIVKARRRAPLKTTGQLVNIIREVVPTVYKKGGSIHFATRTFQALRIATNNELENLIQALPQAMNLLAKKGRIAVISYHSLEDRIVKKFFRQESRDCICPPQAPICQCGHKAKLKIITRKVLIPTDEEIKNNTRARSAKMRVAERI